MSRLEESYVLHVRRGNLQVIFPILAWAARETPVGELAGYIVKSALEAQQAEPGHATDPILADDRPIGLRLVDHDASLDPALPLLAQTEGRWSTAELAVEGLPTPQRFPVCRVDLIDLERPAVVLC